MDPGFLPIWIRTSKTRIRISPFFALIYYWDLSDVLWLGLRGAWPKKIVLRTWECYLGYNIFLNLYLQFLVFFQGSGSGFSGSDPGFLADPDPDSGKNVRSESDQKDPDWKHCILPRGSWLAEMLYITPGDWLLGVLSPWKVDWPGY